MSKSFSTRLISRHAVICVVFSVVFFLLNRPEVILLSRIGFVAWYPAIGVAIALMIGIHPAYAVLLFFVSAIIGKLIYGLPIISYSYAGDGFAVAVCYGTAAWFLRSRMRIDFELRHRRDVVLYTFVIGAAAVIAAVVGAGCLLADHSIGRSDYRSAVIGWFLGDSIGLLGIAPFLLVHVSPWLRSWVTGTSREYDAPRQFLTATRITPGALLEGTGQVFTMIAVLYVTFDSRSTHSDYSYLSLIPIVWIAMRHGMRRVVTGIMGFNCGAAVAMHLFPPTASSFTEIGFLMLVLSITGLLVGSEVSERHRMAGELNERTTYLNSLIENSPHAMLVLDRSGGVELANPAYQKMFLHDGKDLASLSVPELGGTGEGSSGAAKIIADVFAGEAVHQAARQRGKDGQEIDVSIDAVPLVLNGQVRGAYLIYQDISEQTRATEAQRTHAEALDKLVQELKRHTQEMTMLNRMGHLLECSATVEEACRVVAHSVVQLCPESMAGSLYLFRSSRNVLEEAIHWGKSETAEPSFSPDACWALRQGQPHWSEHPGSGVSCTHLRSSSTASGLCVPLVAQGNTIGILYLEFGRDAVFGNLQLADSLQESRQRLAVSVGAQIALSLASLKLRETLHEQSIRDPLTGLYNRRFLEETLEREVHRARREMQSLAVMLMDLDHFKRFNDTFGHDAGDFVLRSVADLFRNFFRASDVCCRQGGEEFAIVMPTSSAQDAERRGSELREEVKKLKLQYKNQMLGPLTASIGLAAFPDHASSAGELLMIADRCVYASKAGGRDRVTVASNETIHSAVVPEWLSHRS